ncbi:suppressor of fused domain protein [Ramlibacter albus]|uniref:Suppressor of fused domain protein n=1 Tax=Ramlibacter albus TaxID=2079448 RepID=A0A923M889_9BURK|nr:suppressor of fused domain protein [Ramlibacter albus]MBC5765648.1 suppressor of fused domain protein [Ramlibacter albus]
MADDELVGLPAHIEDHIGPISQGWSDESRVHGIQVVEIADRPCSGVNTLGTIGLSHHPLSTPSSKRIRQELLLSAERRFDDRELAKLLLYVAEERLSKGNALLRGQVVPLGAPVISGSKLTEVFVTNPSPFEEALVEFSSVPPLVFAYLIPVSPSEAMMVRSKGWRWFEEYLQVEDPNIWDLHRVPSLA